MIMLRGADMGGHRFCAWLHSIIPTPREKDEEPVEEVHIQADELRGRAEQQRARLYEAEARLHESRRRRNAH